MSYVVDAGAFVAVERDDAYVISMLEVARRDRVPLLTSGAVVAQVWRNGMRQAKLARALAGVRIRPLDDIGGKKAGELLGASKTSDVVDAHVALLASRNDSILTSDPRDLKRLLETRGISAVIVPV